MDKIDPNSFDKEIEDAQKDIAANPQKSTLEGTEQKDTDKKTEQPPAVDYRQKFVQSAKGVQNLLKEKQDLEAENARLRGTQSRPEVTDDLIPGFDELEPEQKDNLIAYTKVVTDRARGELMKDPAIAFAKQNYNESMFNNALDVVVAEFPALQPNKADFKSLYFNASNVPDNILEILQSMAKVYLFDKARDIGAEEAKAAADRVDLEDTTGGDRTPSARRSLADWALLARTNPAKFASLKKEYDSDIESGQLKE